MARIAVEVPETQTYHLAPNEAASPDGYNWVLQGRFADDAAMAAYRAAPLHREFVAYCEPFTEDFLIATCRLPPVQ